MSVSYFPPRPLIKGNSKGGGWVKIYNENPVGSGHDVHRQRNSNAITTKNVEENALTYTFILNKFNLSSADDICEMDISGMDLEDGPPDRISEFSSLAKIDASDNMLSFIFFQHFPRLTDLNLSLNQLYRISVPEKFIALQHLDLSYNFLDGPVLMNLGLLPALTTLYMSGNGIQMLPPDLAEPHVNIEGTHIQRFTKLEILHLDDNKLSNAEDIASLATLPKLRVLNLASNQFRAIPLLKSVRNDADLDEESSSSSSSVSKSSAKQRMGSVRKITPENKELLNQKSYNNDHSNDIIVHGMKLELSFGNHSKLLSRQESESFPIVPAPTERSYNAAPDSDGVDNMGHKIHNIQATTKMARRLPPALHRNLLAPRVRIVDEYVGVSTAQKIFSDRKSVKRLSKSVHTSQSDKINQPSVSTIQNLITLKATPQRNIRNNRKQGRRKLLDQQNLAKRSTSAVSLTKLTEAAKSELTTPPFPSLELIDLSHNRLMYEQHLLPVAVWPHLKELVIHHNPVVSRHTGPPPLLQKLLVDRLHLNLRRSACSPSWFSQNGQLVEWMSWKPEQRSTQASETNKPLALCGPLMTKTGTMSTRQILTANQSRLRQITRKNSRRGPLVIPNKLTSKQLHPAPKPTRCNPEKMLQDYHSATERPSNDPSLTPSSSKSFRSAEHSSLSSQKNNELQGNLLDSFGDEHFLPETNSTNKTSRVQTSSRSDLSPTLPKGDFLLDDGSSFFTTQLAEFGAIQTTSEVTRESNVPKLSETDNPKDETDSIANPSSPGPLLPQLEWLVDESNLPETMQACLRELRHLCQHPPIIHSVRSPQLALTDKEETVKTDKDQLLPNLLTDAQDDILEVSDDYQFDVFKNQCAMLCKDVEEMKLVETAPKLQYTSMLAVHLPKALGNQNEICTTKFEPTVSNYLCKPKQETGKTNIKPVTKKTAQLAKNVFHQ